MMLMKRNHHHHQHQQQQQYQQHNGSSSYSYSNNNNSTNTSTNPTIATTRNNNKSCYRNNRYNSNNTASTSSTTTASSSCCSFTTIIVFVVVVVMIISIMMIIHNISTTTTTTTYLFNNNYYYDDNNHSNNNSNRYSTLLQQLQRQEEEEEVEVQQPVQQPVQNQQQQKQQQQQQPIQQQSFNIEATDTNTTTATSSTATASSSTTSTTTSAIDQYRYNILQVNSSLSSIQCYQKRYQYIQQQQNYNHNQQYYYIPNLRPVQDCLQLTYPNNNNNNKKKKNPTNYLNISTLQYPMDAEYHYHTIRYSMAQYAQHTKHIIHSAANYHGPWLENHFITYYETLYDTKVLNHNSDDSDSITCLHDIFGPYIPIFIPWVDHLVSNKYKYPENMIATLRTILRPNVPYITISQNARGLKDLQNEMNLRQYFPNLVILSAGGHGHVSIPLVKQNEVLVTKERRIPIQQRPIDISYVGSLGNAPYNVREYMNTQLQSIFSNYTINTLENMIDTVKTRSITTTSSEFPELDHPRQRQRRQLQQQKNNKNNNKVKNSQKKRKTQQEQQQHANGFISTSTVSKLLHNFTYVYYYGKDWRIIQQLSKYHLVPRGFGRTAYHLVETIQMGYIPIVLYLENDIPWIPYYNTIYHQYIGYDTTFEQLPKLLEQLLLPSVSVSNDNNNNNEEYWEQLEQREASIASYIDSHFTVQGILQQIQYFLLQGEPVSINSSNSSNTLTTTTITTSTTIPKRIQSDLICQALPKYVTGIPKYGT